MQPVQLSLLPDEGPAPLQTLISQFPQTDVAAAIALLATLIAAMAGPATGTGPEASGGE